MRSRGPTGNVRDSERALALQRARIAGPIETDIVIGIEAGGVLCRAVFVGIAESLIKGGGVLARRTVRHFAIARWAAVLSANDHGPESAKK